MVQLTAKMSFGTTLIILCFSPDRHRKSLPETGPGGA